MSPTRAPSGLGAHPIALRVAEAGGLVLIATVLAGDRGSWPIPRADPDCSVLEGRLLLNGGDAPVSY